MFENNMMEYFVVLSITLVICSFTTASYTHVYGKHIKPFGPRMCEELCKRVGRCTSFIFEVTDLSCGVDGSVNSKRSTKDSVLSRDQLQISFRGGVLSCPTQFKTILTRKKGLKCVKYSAMKEDEVTEASPKTRLLIARLHSNPKIMFHQLFLSNGSLKTFPFIRVRRVTAITFGQTSKRVLIAAYSKIMSVRIDSSKKTVIQTGIKVSSMAVDEEKDILFVTFHGKVKKMTSTGQHLQTVFAFPREIQPGTIVLDPSQNRIFARSFYYILSVTYEGANMQILLEGTGIYTLLFDPERSLLYYSRRTEVFSFSLSMNMRSELLSISFAPKNMVYFNNDFYVYGSRGEIGVIRDREYKKLTNINDNQRNKVMVCLIQ